MSNRRSSNKTRKIGRDSATGRFIPVDEARRSKRTAIIEKIKVGKRRSEKGYHTRGKRCLSTKWRIRSSSAA